MSGKRRSRAPTQRRSGSVRAAPPPSPEQRARIGVSRFWSRACRLPTRAPRRGLTLIELMVVVVILGVLATTVTLVVRDHLITGKQNAAKQELALIMSALELFYLENDRYPTSVEGLALLKRPSEKHPDGLLAGGDLNDPWNTPYEYLCPGLKGSYELICFGADRAEGGSGANADIVSWDLK